MEYKEEDKAEITPAYQQPTTSTVSARIRQHRKSRSLTLHDVERLSSGRIKAVVMGSYERGTRAISLARTIEIANLFNIPVTDLIAEPTVRPSTPTTGKIFDLRKVGAMALQIEDPDIHNLNRYLMAIAVRRSDWNGEVLTLRASDFDSLTLLLNKPTEELFSVWIRQKIILIKPSYL